METNPNPRGRDELTADPLFLFQRREIHIHDPGPQWEWHTECEAFVAKAAACQWGLGPTPEEYPEADWPDAEDVDNGAVPTISAAALYASIGSECGVDLWHTERIFLTREEGERYGKARAYNYPEGWRVYCVPCLGDLAKLLAAYDKHLIQIPQQASEGQEGDRG